MIPFINRKAFSGVSVTILNYFNNLSLSITMEEKRTIERIRCYYYLKVYAKDTKKDIGSVIDISTKGMRLVSETPFEVNSPYQFTVKLPEGYILGDKFDIDAAARWCNKTETFYETGFEFVNAERKGVIYVKSLISDFKNNQLL